MKSCSFFFYNYQELNPGELKGGLHGGAGILSRINNSLIFSLSSQLIIPYFSADSTENFDTDACAVYVLHWASSRRYFSLHRVFFKTQNGSLVIKFDQLIFAILLYMT